MTILEKIKEAVESGVPLANLNGYDYDNQAWVVAGKYIRCGHPDGMACGCFGKKHEGETVSPAVAGRIREQ